MNLYYASFIPGLQNIIADVIRERLSDVNIHKLLDGAVLFETEKSYDKLNFFCFNNIFACIDIMEHSESQTSGGCETLEKHIRAVCNSAVNLYQIANNSKDIRSFRIVVSDENTPVSIDEKLRLQAELFLSRHSGLKVNRSLPDTEFWFLYRKEDGAKTSECNTSQDFSIFMKRLTLRPSWEKTLHKGELPPPLAWTLCRLVNLVHTDTVLDPFCGYGSIPDAAMKHFHITKFIACDNNTESASYTASRFKKRKTGDLVLHTCDFNALPSLIAEKSIDVIITDPPWGNFKKHNDNSFPEKMFNILSKLLKDGGTCSECSRARAVMLYANDENFLKAVPVDFEVQESIPILLSGKKAVILVLKKL